MKRISHRLHLGKHFGILLTAVVLSLSLAGCGSGDFKKQDAEGETERTIDIDLPSMSATMVYSQVYDMIVDPDAYMGKVVRMEGVYTVYNSEETGNHYTSCIIQDATACCAQGMEFVLTDNYSYPDDYPEEGDIVEVVGVFDTYREGEYLYCHLKDAKLV